MAAILLSLRPLGVFNPGVTADAQRDALLRPSCPGSKPTNCVATR